MHDPRPQHAANSGEIANVVEQGVHERAGGVPGAGMNHQPGGLVEDQQPGVLEDDRERDRLGRRLRGLGLGDLDLDQLSGLDARRGPARPAVQRDVAGADQRLETGAAVCRQPLDEPGVEALARRGLIDRKAMTRGRVASPGTARRLPRPAAWRSRWTGTWRASH